MNKIRVIDLLNKIANGEEVPKEFIYKCIKYKFHNNDYYDEEYDNWFFRDIVFDVLEPSLNDEVEILEEEKKLPKKLNKHHFHNRQRQLANKINEIIDYLQYLKSKGE